MKVAVCVVASLVVLAVTSAFPAAEWEPIELPKGDLTADDFADLIAPQQEERSLRQARVTCDLLSVSTPWITANHAICAAHCLAKMKGYRGGRCINGVCNCRK